MVSKMHILADSLFTVVTLIVVFLVNLFLVEQFDTKTMTPMIFVLGVFLVSWREVIAYVVYETVYHILRFLEVVECCQWADEWVAKQGVHVDDVLT